MSVAIHEHAELGRVLGHPWQHAGLCPLKEAMPTTKQQKLARWQRMLHHAPTVAKKISWLQWMCEGKATRDQQPATKPDCDKFKEEATPDPPFATGDHDG
jgi:hypothetical protein